MKTNSPIPEILILSCSLRPESNSRILAGEAKRRLNALDAPNRLVDLRDYTLPLCDGESAYEHEAVAPLTQAIASAGAILAAAPIYNYDLNAAVKNLIELTGDAWNGKLVGGLFAAGGLSGYMSPMSLFNSLMFDFRCIIIPRYVYADRSAFANGALVSDKIAQRVEELSRETVRLATALNKTESQK